MIFLDSRAGSGDLENPLRGLGLTVDVIPQIDFGDVAFFGHGPEGENSLMVGVEIKKIRDLIQSIGDGRLAGHQLIGLHRQYDIRCLLVEGLWRPAADGVLEIGKHLWERDHVLGQREGRLEGVFWEPLELGRRRFMYAEVDKAIATLTYKTGVYYLRTASREETARAIRDAYSWWTDKLWDQHRAHLALHQPADTAFLVPPPLRRCIAAELPGVGHTKSGAVAAFFPTTLDMITADVKTWSQIEGIGKTLAQRIYERVRRE